MIQQSRTSMYPTTKLYPCKYVRGVHAPAVRPFYKYRRGSPKRVIWVTRIAITLLIFNLSTRFLAQIVENREARLSRPFLGHGDNFSKSYDENQIQSERECVCTQRGRRAGRRPGFGSQITSSNVWQVCFRHNFSKKLSPGPKNGLERRASRFSTICAKNQQLKLSIDKVILEQSASLK